MLSCYKTEQCRKPARLCRQGYACPFYHNSKDRRRPPAICKYRYIHISWMLLILTESSDFVGLLHVQPLRPLTNGWIQSSARRVTRANTAIPELNSSSIRRSTRAPSAMICWRFVVVVLALEVLKHALDSL